MKTFDKNSLKNFRQDFDEAVKELSKKYGMSISLGNISYTPTEFTTKITARKFDIVDGVEVIKTSDFTNKIANQIIKSAGIDFKGDNFIGTNWMINSNKRFTVIGYNSKRPKNCWEVKFSDGTVAVAPTGFFKRFDVKQTQF